MTQPRSNDYVVSQDAGATELEPVIGRERIAMGQDLTRARELLRDGMAKLHGFFDVLRTSVNAQAASLAKLQDDGTDREGQAAAIQDLVKDHQRLLDQSEAAVLGLQLDDILGQLLEYTRQRADGLSHIAATLAAAVDQQSLVQSESLRRRLEEAVAEIEAHASRRSVQQQSLDTGEVELF